MSYKIGFQRKSPAEKSIFRFASAKGSFISKIHFFSGVDSWLGHDWRLTNLASSSLVKATQVWESLRSGNLRKFQNSERFFQSKNRDFWFHDTRACAFRLSLSTSSSPKSTRSTTPSPSSSWRISRVWLNVGSVKKVGKIWIFPEAIEAQFSPFPFSISWIGGKIESSSVKLEESKVFSQRKPQQKLNGVKIWFLRLLLRVARHLKLIWDRRKINWSAFCSGHLADSSRCSFDTRMGKKSKKKSEGEARKKRPAPSIATYPCKKLCFSDGGNSKSRSSVRAASLRLWFQSELRRFPIIVAADLLDPPIEHLIMGNDLEPTIVVHSELFKKGRGFCLGFRKKFEWRNNDSENWCHFALEEERGIFHLNPVLLVFITMYWYCCCCWRYANN